MTDLSNETIESIFQNLDALVTENEERDEKKVVAFWIPAEYKEKYDLLQDRTKKHFGKLIAQLIMKSVDKASVKHL